MVDLDHPITITIPVPYEIVRARGIHSTGKYGTSLRVRMTKADRDIIRREAERIGITSSMFLRWCGVAVAAKLQEARTGERYKVDG